jgi:hypothetical protein
VNIVYNISFFRKDSLKTFDIGIFVQMNLSFYAFWSLHYMSRTLPLQLRVVQFPPLVEYCIHRKDKISFISQYVMLSLFCTFYIFKWEKGKLRKVIYVLKHFFV